MPEAHSGRRQTASALHSAVLVYLRSGTRGVMTPDAQAAPPPRAGWRFFIARHRVHGGHMGAGAPSLG
ncbi:hypothetical protein, partial [Stenotrophomonas pictorum]|uniref:hypothetical protein n=1 Tax=Stenotrophomonas pictorum TaxID=86184 RepID=UPI001C436EE3